MIKAPVRPHTYINIIIRHTIYLLAAVLITLPFFTLSSFAADPSPEEDKDDIPLLDDIQEKMLDDTQQDISDRVISAAEWIDSFFDDERVLSEENTSRANLRMEFKYTKNDDFEVSPRVSLRLRLPKLSKRVNFILQAADDDDFNGDGDPAQPDNETERGNIEAALQFFFIDTENQNLSTTFGGSYDYLYGGLRYRYWKDLGKWDLRFTDRLRWYTDDGWENRSTLDLERKISKNWMFRSITSATWEENRDGVPYSEILRLYQVLDDDRAILYETGVYFDTEPENDVVDVQLRARFRKRFYRDWLVLEITPQVTFPKDFDREANPGIIFKLEADFGYQSHEEVFTKIFRF